MATTPDLSLVPRITATDPIGILKEVVAIIRAEPKRYYQADWIELAGESTYLDIPRDQMPPCGTVCCVAGWITVGKRSKDQPLTDFITRWDDTDNCFPRRVEPWVFAQQVLGLNDAQADRLFDGDAVGKQLEHETGLRRWDDECPITPAIGTPEYVELGIRHIERFMRDEMGYTGPAL